MSSFLTSRNRPEHPCHGREDSISYVDGTSLTPSSLRLAAQNSRTCETDAGTLRTDVTGPLGGRSDGASIAVRRKYAAIPSSASPRSYRLADSAPQAARWCASANRNESSASILRFRSLSHSFVPAPTLGTRNSLIVVVGLIILPSASVSR